MEGKDKEVMDLAQEMVTLLRKHTKSAADRSVVMLAWVTARDLYKLSAPTFMDEVKRTESLATS
ncbi:MAG: hypothetical protein WBQ76_16265 [Candidatus Korobacteraceae bacterium]